MKGQGTPAGGVELQLRALTQTQEVPSFQPETAVRQSDGHVLEDRVGPDLHICLWLQFDLNLCNHVLEQRAET